MALLWRMVVIGFGFFVACFAAGLVLTLAILFPAWSDLAIGAYDEGIVGIAVTFGAIFVSGFALLPALAIIALAETLAIRSILFYAACGAALGFVIYVSLGGFDVAALSVAGNTRRETEIMVGAGIAAGLAYWLVAGRSAGLWRGAPLRP